MHSILDRIRREPAIGLVLAGALILGWALLRLLDSIGA